MRTLGWVCLLLCADVLMPAEETGGPDLLNVRLTHETLDMKVGHPAILRPGGAWPSVQVTSGHDREGVLEVELLREEDGATALRVPAQALRPGQTVTKTLDGRPEPGRYRLQLKFASGDRVLFRDAYYFSVLDPDALPKGHSLAVHPDKKDGRLVYIPDFRGNRIPDFSMVGYGGGAKEIPEVPVKVTVEPGPGDCTQTIQAAIDQVSGMPPDADGLRGAVLLKKGVYRVKGTLHISAGGVVVRGEGPGKDRQALLLDPAAAPSEDALAEMLSRLDGTFLITGKNGFTATGAGELKTENEPAGEILDAYVPVGAATFELKAAPRLQVGDRVMVRRYANEAWIQTLGMDRIPKENPWKPGDYQFGFERTVTAIDGNRVTVHAPILTAIESRWGGGAVYRCEDTRTSQMGIECLRCIQYCTPDEKFGLGRYRGKAVTLSKIKDSWVKDVVVEHYSDDGAFLLDQRSANITIQRCSVLLADDKYYEGYVPRYGFKLKSGLHLVEGCYASSLRHAYYVDYRIMGPNVFHQCVSEKDVSNSEPHHRWSCGGLYDNVSGNIAFMNRLSLGGGHGWSGANYVAWNTRGRLICEQPPTAQNWAIGHSGIKAQGPYHDWRPAGGGVYEGGGYGYWELHRNPRPIGVQASAGDFNHGSEATLDDNPNTYWTAKSPGETIQYDLRKPRKLSALKLSFPAPQEYLDKKNPKEPLLAQDRVYFFDIAVSADGKDWRTVLKDGKGEGKGPGEFQTFAIDPVEARHVRITAKGSSVSKAGKTGSDYFHLSQVLFEPALPVDGGEGDAAAVVPASLYRQQRQERYSR